MNDNFIASNEVLGIDIGGVIIEKIGDESDTSFQKDFINTPAVFGALRTIRQLIECRFGANVHLVSKCGPDIEGLTRRWLDAHFFPTSGIRAGNIHFCLKRSDKASICDALGITHFIDDRLEVLSYLKSVENLYLFQPVDSEVRKFSHHLNKVKLVYDWNELGKVLLLPK